MKRIHLFVSGKVQGVWFRARTEDRAKELCLTGWVKNLDDGRVEVVAEGEEDILKKLIEFCKIGSSESRVDNLEIKWEKFKGEFDQFKALFL